MRVLITGGAGFIGSHLVHSRLARGDAVDVLDDLSTGSIDNVELFQSDPLYRFTCGSILNGMLLVKMARQCDVVFHLAAAVGVRHVIDHPLETVRTNLDGTGRVLAACARLGKRVVFTSSSEVYGTCPVPMRESDEVLNHRGPIGALSYAATKLLGERFALEYARIRVLPVVIARLFNTSGPRQTGRFGMVLPRFARQAVSGAPLTVYGDGAQTRTFTHVTDTVECLNRLMACDVATGEIVNVGGGEEVSMLELARRVKARAMSDSVISRIPCALTFRRNYDETSRRAPSTEKLRRLTGFAPAVSLDTIIDDVLDSARKVT